MKLFLTVFSLILVISLLLTGLIYFLRRRFGAPAKTADPFHPSIFTFYTSLYAFFLGFAIVTLWSAFLNAERNLTKEADSLLIAYRASLDLPDSQGFRQTLRDYVKLVLDDEWPRMEAGAMSNAADRRFDQVWDQVRLLKPKDAADLDLYLNIRGLLGEASSLRLARALLMNGNLYPPVWVIIIVGFATMCFGLYFLHVQQTGVRLIFDFMVLFLLLSCIYFIYDIDTPFSGYITVKPDVFQHVYDKMQNLP